MVAAQAQDARGAHGTLAAPVLEASIPTWPARLGISRPLTEILVARRCAALAFAQHPELVWERYSLYSDAGWKLNAAGIPWILEVNAPLCEERQRYEGLKGWRVAHARAWERDVLRAAPHIIAVSRWLCDWLKHEIGCTGTIRHMPNGVEGGQGDRTGTRNRLGIAETQLVIGFLGTMKPWHGLSRLPAILDALPEAVALLVGDGPVGLDHPRVLRVGQVPEVETTHYAAAMDVGLALYGPDAPPWFCPLKILAYRAQGTPIVATDTGDCRELVGDTGTILPVDAPAEAWAEAIRGWAGRRCQPMLRGWDQVVSEVLEGFQP